MTVSVIIVVATFMCMSMGMAIFFTVRMSMVVRMLSMIVIVVMVAAWGLMKNPNENQVEDQAENCGDEHDLAFDVVFDKASLDGLNEQVNSDGKQEYDRHDGANDLRPVPPEGKTCR